MKIEVAKGKPVVYVDMDGVLADLFNYAATLQNVDHYQKMTDEETEKFFRSTNAYELFSSIPMFSTANRLLKMVSELAGGYTILSSPLSYDTEGSIRGKREWLHKNITVLSDGVIFEKDKAKYAVSADGTPNILIDDWGTNVRNWNAAGGKAIKYQADEDSFEDLRVKFLSALT
jgi:5'(3')-deoxyribonucleotidase